MENNKEKLDNFKKNTDNLLDSLNAFAPSIDGMKNLAEAELTDEVKALTDQFAIDGEGKSYEELMELKKEFLIKLENVTK